MPQSHSCSVCKNRVEQRRLTFLCWHGYASVNNECILQAGDNAGQCGPLYTSSGWDWTGKKHSHSESSNITDKCTSVPGMSAQSMRFLPLTMRLNQQPSKRDKCNWCFAEAFWSSKLLEDHYTSVNKWSTFHLPSLVNNQNSDARLQNLHEIYSDPWIMNGVVRHCPGRHNRTLKRHMVQGHAAMMIQPERPQCASSRRTTHILQECVEEKLPKGLTHCPVPQSDNLMSPAKHPEFFLPTIFCVQIYKKVCIKHNGLPILTSVPEQRQGLTRTMYEMQSRWWKLPNWQR